MEAEARITRKPSGSAAGLALLLLIALGASAAQPQPRTATLSWNYDYSSHPPCSKTRTADCVRGFKVTVEDKRHDSKDVPNAFDASGAVLKKGIHADLQVEQFGDVRFCVAAIGVSARGKDVLSDPECKTTKVQPHESEAAK